MDTLQVDQPHEGVTRIVLNRPERLKRHERGAHRRAS